MVSQTGRTTPQNLGIPDVSHSSSLTFSSSLYTSFVTTSAPIVGVAFLGSNLFWVYPVQRGGTDKSRPRPQS